MYSRKLTYNYQLIYCAICQFTDISFCVKLYRGDDMSTEAQKRASIAYNRRQDNIMIRPSKEKGAEIRKAAEIAQQSVQAYVWQAVDERMARDKAE